MDSLDRLYRRMADVLLREPATAITVGDVYQHLVPYRSVRAELGFSEMAEYEHALLRLFSGERDYLVVERAEVQEDFQRELRSPNPILGVYRDYAEVGVYLNPYAPELPALDHTAPPPPAVPASPAPEGNGRAAAAPAEPVAAPRPRLRACSGCRAPLPPDREVRFCPLCGKCLTAVPCPECSAMVEPEWRFCASCGWPRDGGHPGGHPPEQRLR